MTNAETTRIAQVLKDACQAIAGNCDGAMSNDGVGFNKADTSFGRSIALSPAQHWTPEICHEVCVMLKKYSKQLSNAGIEYAELPTVERQRSRGRSVEAGALKEIAAKAEKSDVIRKFAEGTLTLSETKQQIGDFRLMKIVEKSLVASFPFDRDLVDAIKSISYGDRHWDGISRRWVISANAAPDVLRLIEEWDFLVTDADMERIKRAANRNPPQPPKPKRKSAVSFDGDRIVLTTPYNADLTNDIRSIPGRKWDADNKVNTFPTTQAAVIIDLAANYNLYISDEARAKLENFETLRAQKVEQSAAVDADIEIHGLADDIELRPFQKAGIKYALKAKRVIIGDEMGLGKTPQGMCTVQAADAYPCLVICPKAVKAQWGTEIKKFLPGRIARTIVGKKETGPIPHADFIIINYDILDKHCDSLAMIEFKSVIIDESHYVKNNKTKRSDATAFLASLPGVEYVIMLTGTPVLNRPVELTNQLDILGRLDSDFGGFFKFAMKYCDATQNSHGWDFKGASNLDELAVRLRETCFVRREKKDVCTELPELQRSIVTVETTSKTKFKRATKALTSWMAEVQITT